MFPDLPPDDPFLYDPDFGNFLPPPNTFEAPKFEDENTESVNFKEPMEFPEPVTEAVPESISEPVPEQ
mgnify:CR=1 FL=1